MPDYDTRYEDWYDAQEILEEEAVGRYAADLLVEEQGPADLYKVWEESILKARDFIIKRNEARDKVGKCAD